MAGTAAILVGVSVAHLAEDFVYGVPAKFGLSVATAAVTAGFTYAAHVALIALAARGQALGYVGNVAAGAVWFLAAALDHLGEVLFASPYRAGLISKAMAVGAMAGGLNLSAVSFLARPGEEG